MMNGWVRSLSICSVLLISGCTDELGPVRLETTRIVGIVREGLTPVHGGFIEFVPIDGTVGNMHSSPIGSDGTFAVDGVAVGTNAIGLAALKGSMPSTLTARFGTLHTPIRRTIKPGPSTDMIIDLYEEIARFQNEREAAGR